MRSWGLESALKRKSVRPKSLFWKRWQDGRVIGHTRYKPFFEHWFGIEYFVTHRADLHQVLHEKAVELGVKVRLGSTVLHYNVDDPSFELKGGVTISADLIVAADGEL